MLTCKNCCWWKRRINEHGACWSSHQATVPVYRVETDSCEKFVDQLVNRKGETDGAR
jgi:hypothetical protein